MAKFINMQEFKKKDATLDETNRYLSEELASSLRSLKTGLPRLTFEDNFESFEVTTTIAAGATAVIRNEFRNNIVPTRRLIVRCTGTPLIVDGVWDANFVRLTNTGAVSATITVIFLR